MNKVIFDKRYGHNTRQTATYEREDFYYIDKQPEHIKLERKTNEGEHDWVLLTFEELEQIYLAAKETRTIMKWVETARERGGTVEDGDPSDEVVKAIQECEKELGIKEGSLEGIELTETFLDYFEESQG